MSSWFLQLLDSKALDSSILDFWATSGLAPQKDGRSPEEGVRAWPSNHSLLNPPAGPPTDTTQGPARLLRRRKALMQLRLASPSSPHSHSALLPHTYTPPPPDDPPTRPGRELHIVNVNPPQTHSHNLTTILTLSGEKIQESSLYSLKENLISSLKH